MFSQQMIAHSSYILTTLLLFLVVLCCLEEGGAMCFPTRSNGYYVATTKFLKANIKSIPARLKVGFKIIGNTLSILIETVNKTLHLYF